MTTSGPLESEVLNFDAREVEVLFPEMYRNVLVDVSTARDMINLRGLPDARWNEDLPYVLSREHSPEESTAFRNLVTTSEAILDSKRHPPRSSIADKLRCHATAIRDAAVIGENATAENRYSPFTHLFEEFLEKFGKQRDELGSFKELMTMYAGFFDYVATVIEDGSVDIQRLKCYDQSSGLRPIRAYQKILKERAA